LRSSTCAAPRRCSSCAVWFELGGAGILALNDGGIEERWGGGGVTGARGTTLGDAATLDTGVADGCRSGGGGGERSGTPPGTMPREDGGGGMREVGGALPYGRGTTLTGRGGTTDGSGAGAGGATSPGVLALGSFSSPIVTVPRPRFAPRRDFNRQRRYLRSIS
jgi:hypothetical protein